MLKVAGGRGWPKLSCSAGGSSGHGVRADVLVSDGGAHSGSHSGCAAWGTVTAAPHRHSQTGAVATAGPREEGGGVLNANKVG